MSLESYCTALQEAGCPEGQASNFLKAGLVLQAKQLAASAAARECDRPDGPFEIGYGGARGGGKSHWMLAQIGADDCQRAAGIKCLLLRKVGKANLEHLEDLRRKVLHGVPHEFTPSRATLTFPNGSRIIAGHFQNERDVDSYLGLEYDVIGVEEATTLTHRKYLDISTCCRSSRGNWRPRIYSTTNPGGVGHAWYRQNFIRPWQGKNEMRTRFVQALESDNSFNNVEYRQVLEGLGGWQKRAWLYGDWDIAAGQYFSTFRREDHVTGYFPRHDNLTWVGALDYGFTHYTVFLLACRDGDGNWTVVDEHAERKMLPAQHCAGISKMLGRHGLTVSDLDRVSAGTDVFATQADGRTIAAQYARRGFRLSKANMDRVNGWAEVLELLGDPANGEPGKLKIHERCGGLIERLPDMQHNPAKPEDIKKVDCDEEGRGGDDHVDCLRYLLATKGKGSKITRLHGL